VKSSVDLGNEEADAGMEDWDVKKSPILGGRPHGDGDLPPSRPRPPLTYEELRLRYAWLLAAERGGTRFDRAASGVLEEMVKRLLRRR